MLRQLEQRKPADWEPDFPYRHFIQEPGVGSEEEDNIANPSTHHQHNHKNEHKPAVIQASLTGPTAPQAQHLSLWPPAQQP